MRIGPRPGFRTVAAVSIAAAALFVTACAPEEDDSESGNAPTSTPTTAGNTTAAAADPCAIDQLNLITPGTLTIATDDPAFPPWFIGNDPSNGKGFEGAVAKAVAEQMGFTQDQVTWVVEPFNKSYAPGEKDFDFDINQISILPKRAEAVDFSDGYYSLAQAVVVLEDSEFADATTLADLKDARIGAQIGTTSLLAAQDTIQPNTQVAVYDDTNAAKQALLNGQVDAIIADVPTAFYITAVEIPGSTILGQFEAVSGEPEEFGLLFEKGNPLVECVNVAIEALKADGTLDQLDDRWLAQAADVPELG
jgi:polar amino acid transport system substrate-binding protein